MEERLACSTTERPANAREPGVTLLSDAAAVVGDARGLDGGKGGAGGTEVGGKGGGSLPVGAGGAGGGAFVANGRRKEGSQ